MYYWASAIAAGDTGASGGLSVDNPLVLGPIAAFIFTIFVSEIVVSGKAYKREVEENQRLRTLIEKVVPLSETMVTTTKEVTEAMKKVADNLEAVLDVVLDDDTRRKRRP